MKKASPPLPVSWLVPHAPQGTDQANQAKWLPIC